MSIEGPCPYCNNEADLVSIHCEEEFNIRGLTINVPVEYHQCSKCGEKITTNKKDNDPYDFAYREYRKRTNMLQPEDIKAFRKSLKLTQREMSEVLGIGIATLNRYENGALQTEAHDQMIRLLMTPTNLAKRIENQTGSLSQRIIDKIQNTSNQENVDAFDLIERIVTRYGSYKPDILSGYLPFNIDKFFQVIKFFCNDRPIVKTKLMKLCFYTDFEYYKENGISITGARYAHADHGPVPDKFETWLTSMYDWTDELTMEEKTFGEFTGEEFTSNDVDLSIFSPSEISVLDSVRKRFQNYSAKRIREYSHNEEGYKATENGQLISYEFAEKLQT